MQPPDDQLTHLERGLGGYHCKRQDTGTTSPEAGSVGAAIVLAIQSGHGPHVGLRGLAATADSVSQLNEARKAGTQSPEAAQARVMLGSDLADELLAVDAQLAAMPGEGPHWHPWA
jgi:hypothetical protein